MAKGEIIVPCNIGHNNKKSNTEKAIDFNGQRLVFVLRNKDGQEFYVEDILAVNGDNCFSPISDIVSAGDNMITAFTKNTALRSAYYGEVNR